MQKWAITSTEKLSAAAPDEPIEAMGLFPKPATGDLENFGKLESTLYRGARPTEKGIQQLANMGVHLIVNLENQEKPVLQEKTWAQKYGIRFVNIPLSIITPPSESSVTRFLSLASDPANRPMYFHCMQGRDRTGCMAFCYRLSKQGWAYDSAYQEMVDYHFHTYLLGLRYFLKKYSHDLAS
jgi:protein tyrosine/serine phosphatase